MPITVNDGGVLRTLSAVTANGGGAIYEMNTVHTNDGGVLREIFHVSKGATVEGITPLVVAEDHIVIVDSGTFTLSAPAGARIIVGGGAQDGQKSSLVSNWQGNFAQNGLGGKGGYVAVYTFETVINNATCFLSIGERVNYGETQTTTTLAIGGTTYNSGSTVQIIQSKWGPIGGDGGLGGINSLGSNGTGAGGGGGSGWNVTSSNPSSGFGGNYDGYGNKGETTASSIYLSGGGNGGKGGYGSGGGGAGIRKESSTSYVSAKGGKGGAGIIVIEWDN